MNWLFRQRIPSRKGRVLVVGLGPGKQKFRTFAAEHALKNADDILGYNFYIDLAGPFAKHQLVHKSNNCEEMARAHHALTLASQRASCCAYFVGRSGYLWHGCHCF
ncbi:MAG: Precorrin-3B methylase [Candidatus Tokpelaia sp. JSC189]|nr:MAG: Precorrin-3B methylase [Candidatus Tokpelaia sp. JSC189]